MGDHARDLTKDEATSGQILDILGEKNSWTASTVKTFLKRLVDKGYLTRKRSGKAFSTQVSCLSKKP